MTRINEAIAALRDTTSTDRKLEILSALHLENARFHTWVRCDYSRTGKDQGRLY